MSQEDTDKDYLGDACDSWPNDPDNDADGDGVSGEVDNCPSTFNSQQENGDNDTHGDACDNCPFLGNEDQADGESDDVGDPCDNCPDDPNSEQSDSDGDEVGDICDNCPSVVNITQSDWDGDGLGDACDDDIDGDGLLNGEDNCPIHYNTDQDDVDEDGVGDICDNCTDIYNPDQSDSDGDIIGDACDAHPDVFDPMVAAVDGHYQRHENRYTWFFGSCNGNTSSSVLNGIDVGYVAYCYPFPGNCDCDGDYFWYEGILEFDISKMYGLFARDQIEATLQLTVMDGNLSNAACLSFYSIEDENENGIVEITDRDTDDYLGQICEDLQPGDTITIDITSALEHDLFGPDHANFSGFVVKRSTSWYNYIQFYDHTDPENGPRLTVIDILYSDYDADGIPYVDDNCASVPNPDQIDMEGDGVGDACDNCLNTNNPNQEDTYPPQGNGIGDACDCEGNFNCFLDQDVDGSDAATFKVDFGRSDIVHPCIAGDTCNGDFNCDGDVDGTDASLFKQDFGRNTFSNLCPTCEAGEWCGY